METIEKNKLKELESQQKDFTEQVKKQKAEKYRKTVNFCCFALAIFSLVTFILLVIGFAFVGMARFYSIEFSFVGIYRWLDGLPNATRNEPSKALTQLILGFIFLVFFIIIFVFLIIFAVKLARKMIALSDIAVNEMNPVYLALDMTRLTVSAISFVLLFVFACSCTTTKGISLMSYIFIAVFMLLLVSETVMKILYVYYDEESGEYKGKQTALYLVKRFVQVFLPLLTALLLSEPYLEQFANNVQVYKSLERGVGLINVFYMFILPLFEFTLLIVVFSLFTQTLNYGCYDLCVNTYSYFDKNTSNNDNYLLKEKVKKLTNLTIFLFVSVSLLKALFVLLAVDSAQPELFIDIVLRMLFGILMSVAIKITARVKVDYPAKIIH